MHNKRCYIENSNDFIKKIKHLKNICDNALLVTADVVVLYPSTPDQVRLRTLKEVLERREEKKIYTEGPKWLSLCFRITTSSSTVRLNIIYQEQLLALNLHLHMYASSWMRQKLNFHKHKEFTSLVWLRYIDDVFLFGPMVQRYLCHLRQS